MKRILTVLLIVGIFSANPVLAAAENKTNSITSEIRLGVFNTGEVDTLPAITYSIIGSKEKTMTKLTIDLSAVSDSGREGVVYWSRDFLWANVDYSYLFKLAGEEDTGFYAGPGISISAGVAGDGTEASCFSGWYSCSQALVDAVAEDKKKPQDTTIGFRLTAGYNLTKTINIDLAYIFNSGIDDALYMGIGYKF